MDETVMFLGPDPAPHRPTRLKVPAGACDSHAHVIGPHADYALSGRKGVVPPEATLDAYMAMLDALGIDRGVLVQPSAYSTDNTLLCDALAAHPRRLRGIAIPDYDTVTVADLVALRDRGVRGVRFNTRGSAPTSAGASPPMPLDGVRRVGKLLAEAELNAQMLVLVDRFPDIAAQLADFPVDIVIDHMGYPDAAAGADGAGLLRLLRWLETGRVWVKLSAPYRFSSQDLPYANVAAIARRLIEAAPERMLWATDWPHSAVFVPGKDPRAVPNDGALFDVLADWCPDAATQRTILVDNPARLYGFEA